MPYLFNQLKKSLFRVTALIACAAAAASAQTTTTTTGSVALPGSEKLSYTVIHKTLIQCNPNSHVFVPSYQTWTFDQFVYTDAAGTTHPVAGAADYLQVTGSGTGCPESGGVAVTLTGQDFFINVQPGPGTLTAALNVSLFPQYYILSIVYAPPGNQSSNGYTNAVSNAATTTVSKTFQTGVTTAVSVSAPGGSGFGVTFGASESNQNSQAFQISTSQGTGTQVSSNRNPIDHTQDQIFLWLNPAVTVTPTGTDTGNYSLSTPLGSNGLPEPMDVVNVNVEDLQNPSLIPIGFLTSQTRDNVSGLPGLASICAHPVAQCTTAPCGCVASDFATILAADLLIGSAQTTPPSQVNPSRFVFISSQTLEGPECTGCDPVKNSFTETDAQTTTDTETSTDSYSVGFTTTSGFSFLGGGLTLARSNTFTWTNAMSVGMSNGTSHTASVTLGSSSVDCVETVNIYEDTVYHTYAFAPAVTPPTSCN